MGMRLYDTAREAVVPFEPAGPTATLYACGITPYDAAHLGHAAVYLTFDVLQRRLRDLGFGVRSVRNVTDVDDDILRKARELGVHYLDLAAEEMARFDADMASLALLPVAAEPRATSAIADILSLIGAALDRGHAYESGGAVYFEVATFAGFGDVSHFDRAEDARAGGRPRREPGRPEQARPARLRALAAVAVGRAELGVPLGSRPAGLAHRVLGPRPARARPDDRPPRRWTRPRLSPSRMRDGPVRGGHRPAGSSGTGSTSASSVSTARRCRSRSATSSSSAISSSTGSRPSSAWPCSATTTGVTGSGPMPTCPSRPSGWPGGGRPTPRRPVHLSTVPTRADAVAADPVLDAIRERLDDDLDAPGALVALDEGAAAGSRSAPARRCSVSTWAGPTDPAGAGRIGWSAGPTRTGRPRLSRRSV